MAGRMMRKHLAEGEVPDFHRLLDARRRQAVAVGIDGQPEDGTRVARDRVPGMAGRGVSGSHTEDGPGERQHPAIGAQEHQLPAH